MARTPDESETPGTHDPRAQQEAGAAPDAAPNVEGLPEPGEDQIWLEPVEVREADVTGPTTEVVRRGGTFESFRNRDFVWFWSGALVSNIGTWMQNYALGIIVFSLRRSEFDLGLINFISGIPVLFLAIAGGVIADHVDRRKLLIRIQVVLIVQATTLGGLYSAGLLSSSHAVSALIWMASLGAVAGIFTAVQFPTWQAMLPDLVPRKSLLNAIALNSAQFQSSRLIGPLIAGAFVAAGLSMGGVFYVNAVSFLFVIASLAVVRPRYAPTAQDRASRPREGAIQTVLGGLKYARQNRLVGLLILSTGIMSLFGFSYMTLLPAIVNKTLGFAVNTGPYNRAVALIMAANGLGAMAGALVIASLPRTVRRGRVIPFSMLVFGLSLLSLSLSRNLWLSVAISPIAGAAFLATNSLSNTSIQSAAPGHLRGRVMGLYVMAFSGFMPICGLIFGSIGNATGPANAVLIGSIPLIAWALYLLASQVLARFESLAEPEVA